MREVSEETLMADYVAGDERAFDDLFARVAPRVHAFFLRSFLDTTTADDLLQKTFLKLHRAREEYQTGRPLRPWLFAIAARVRLDELRLRYHLREDCDEKMLAQEIEAQDSAKGRSPDDDSVDIQNRVRLAIQRLPETQRVVVHLHRYEEMTFAEIAEVLATTEGAIKQRAARAYEQLREELCALMTKREVA